MVALAIEPRIDGAFVIRGVMRELVGVGTHIGHLETGPVDVRLDIPNVCSINLEWERIRE